MAARKGPPKLKRSAAQRDAYKKSLGRNIGPSFRAKGQRRDSKGRFR